MIEILKYENNLLQKWDSFIDISNNGTLFHKQKFLSYHLNRKFKDSSFLFKKRGKIVAVFPAAIKKDGHKKILFSHPGASFGGIIYNNLSFEDCWEIIDLIEKIALKNRLNDIFIIQPPNIFSKYQNNEIVDYCLRRKGYDTDENYLSSVLLIEDNVSKQLKKITRNKNRSESYYENLIRKNKLQFKWVNDFDDFYPILIKNKKKHNAKPTHSLEELKKLKSLFPEDILQLMLYNNKIPIGGMTVFKANQNSMIIFYSMFDYTYSSMQPVILLMQYMIKWAKKNGIKFIDYGISHQPNSDDSLALNESLIKFKEEFGCFASIRNTYRKSE